MINILCNIITPESFCITHDYVTITIIYDRYVTVIYNIILNPNSKTKIRKLNKKEIKINRVYYCWF